MKNNLPLIVKVKLGDTIFENQAVAGNLFFYNGIEVQLLTFSDLYERSILTKTYISLITLAEKRYKSKVCETILNS